MSPAGSDRLLLLSILLEWPKCEYDPSISLKIGPSKLFIITSSSLLWCKNSFERYLSLAHCLLS